MRTYKWSEISNYRGEIFGISIISIILFHYFEGVAISGETGKFLTLLAFLYNGIIGSVGVDVFLFLSGYGVFYSLSRKQGFIAFYIKRIERVVIPYLIVGCAFWIIKDLIIGRESFWRFLYDYSLLSFWGEGIRTFWYISLICILYAISPYIYERHRVMFFWGGLSILLTIFLYRVYPSKYTEIEIAILRIPVFLIGMYVASLSKNRRTISQLLFGLLALSVPLKIVWGMYGFPFSRLINGCYAVFLVVLYVVIRHWGDDNSKTFSAMVWFGSYSLELYIVHVALRNLMRTFGLNLTNPLLYAGCIITSVPLSIALSKAVKSLSKTSSVSK